MRHFFVTAFLLFLSSAIVACGPGQIYAPTFTPTPAVTPSPTAAPTLTATPSSAPTLTPTPGGMDVASLIPSAALVNAYIVPVKITQPIVLTSAQFRVTITGARNVSISPTGAAFDIPGELQETHYLLQLELSVKKIADGPLAFGSARTAWSLVSKLEDGSLHVPAGWCELPERNCAPVHLVTLIDRRPSHSFVLFVVPFGTEHISLYLLGSVPIPHP